MQVVVVTGNDLGWDNVVGVFPIEELDKVKEYFSGRRYYVQTRSLDSVSEWLEEGEDE